MHSSAITTLEADLDASIERDINLLLKQAQELKEAADLKKANYDAERPDYIDKLQKLQKFQQSHFPDDSDLLSSFLKANTYRMTHDDYQPYYKISWKKEWTDLLKALVLLSEAIPTSESILYDPLCLALKNAIILSQHLTNAPGFSHRIEGRPIDDPHHVRDTKEKVEVLTQNLLAAADFAHEPFNPVKKDALYLATQKMIGDFDPIHIYPENRARYGLLAAFSMLTGIAIIIAAAVLTATLGSLTSPIALIGVALVVAGAFVESNCILPGYNYEQNLAHKIRSPLIEISKSAKPISSAFFVKKRPGGDDQGLSSSSSSLDGPQTDSVYSKMSAV